MPVSLLPQPPTLQYHIESFPKAFRPSKDVKRVLNETMLFQKIESSNLNETFREEVVDESVKMLNIKRENLEFS